MSFSGPENLHLHMGRDGGDAFVKSAERKGKGKKIKEDNSWSQLSNSQSRCFRRERKAWMTRVNLVVHGRR